MNFLFIMLFAISITIAQNTAILGDSQPPTIDTLSTTAPSSLLRKHTSSNMTNSNALQPDSVNLAATLPEVSKDYLRPATKEKSLSWINIVGISMMAGSLFGAGAGYLHYENELDPETYGNELRDLEQTRNTYYGVSITGFVLGLGLFFWPN
jgi:hypothetical protein